MINRATKPFSCALLASLTLASAGAAAAQTNQANPLSSPQMTEAWHEIATRPDLWQGTWQSISPIADTFPIPPDYTDAARETMRRFRPVEDSPFANCSPLGLPFAMNIGGMPMKFFNTPGMTALYLESSGVTRFIHTDGREHSESPNPTYLGESIGHWEGDTFVVDTIGFTSDTLFQIGRLTEGPLVQGDPSPFAGVVFAEHGPNLRLVERMRLKDFNTLEIQTTVYDETVFKQPYTLPPRQYLRGIERRNDPQEWMCTDNRDHYDTETGELQYNVRSEAAKPGN